MYRAIYTCPSCNNKVTKEYATPPSVSQFFVCSECGKKESQKLQGVYPNPYANLPDSPIDEITMLTNRWTLHNNESGHQFQAMLEPEMDWNKEPERAFVLVADIENCYDQVAEHLNEEDDRTVSAQDIPPMAKMTDNQREAIFKFVCGYDYEFVDEYDRESVLAAIRGEVEKD